MCQLNGYKRAYIFLFITLIMGSVLLVYSYRFTSFRIEEVNNSVLIEYISDAWEGGDSTISRHPDSRYGFSFTLASTLEFPYSFLRFRLQGHKLFDLSRFAYLNYSIKAEKSRSLKSIIYVYVPDYTDPHVFNSYLPLVQHIPVGYTYADVSLKLSDYVIPKWWRNENKVSVEMNQSLLEHVAFIDITANPAIGENCKDTVFIENIYVSEAYVFKLLLYGLLVILVGVAFFMLKLKQQRTLYKNKYTLIVNPHDKAIKRTGTQELILTEDYIGEHYSDKMLDLESVSSATGLPKHRISKAIKDTYALSFPRYLNIIRIKKAEFLLSGTTDRISAIAGQCGYSTVIHFNKAFKQLLSLTPREYRAKVKM